MRLAPFAAAVLVAVAACSTPADAPAVPPAAPPPGEAARMSVDLEDARTWLLDRAFGCRPLVVETGSAVRCVADGRRSGGPYLVVDILADGGGLVRLLQATVDLSAASGPNLADYLGFYAVTVYGIVAPGAPRAVEAWLRDHLLSPGSAAIGRFVLEMAIQPARSSLRIWQRS